jgi:uncharacterized protein YndB with AHSA1/START domain
MDSQAITGVAYTRSLTVAAPIQRAWAALTDATDLEAWLAPKVVALDVRPGGHIVWLMAGHEMRVELTDVAAPNHLSFVEGEDLPVLCRFDLEGIDGGTRVDVTTGGIGNSAWTEVPDGTKLGWDQCLADLILLLDHGVSFNRHQFGNWLGARVRGCPAGVEIVAPATGTWAERAGLQPGDLLVQIGRASVYSAQDVWNAGRSHDAGDNLDVVFVRAGELQRATARV